MNEWSIYHNPNCSKSRQALEWLRQNGIDPLVIEYIHSPPSESELMSLMEKLNSPPSALVRLKEDEFQKSPFDLKSAQEIAKHLATKPQLLERPIVVRGQRAVIGRPLENLHKLVL